MPNQSAQGITAPASTQNHPLSPVNLTSEPWSAYFSRLLSRAKSAMAEILVSDLCACGPPCSSAGFFHGQEGARAAASAASRRTVVFELSSDGSDCSAHCFFHCSPLFPRWRLFCGPSKGLHCNWRAYSIVDRLYFSRKFLGPIKASMPDTRRHEAGHDEPS
jgi:hypothetical protein